MTTTQKRALITGITGQDGSYLAELLLGKGCEVHGLVRCGADFNARRIRHLVQGLDEPNPRVVLHPGNLTDTAAITRLVLEVQPDAIYHLAAQGHALLSYGNPQATLQANAQGTLALLEAVRLAGAAGVRPRVVLASCAEAYGLSGGAIGQVQLCGAHTPMLPVSPLGVSKAAAHALASTYRQAHGMWVASAMLFNHASSRQSETYILRRITRGVGRIRHGLQNTLHLGRTDIVRDWCFAGDVVRALWLMAQRAQATDAVVATGRAVAVDDLVARALARAGLTAAVVETHHARCLRPVEIPQLVGDPTDGLALGWQPELDLFALVDQMVDHDLELAARERVLAEAGHSLAIDPLLI